MQINKDVLKSLNPCADRYKVFLKHHGEFNGSLSEFMDLPNISYEDKTWVAKRVLNKNQAVSWAILCAESVVPVFEKEYPDDKRIRDCIRYLKTVKDFNSLTDTEREEIERHLDIIQKALPAYAAFAAHYAAHAARYALYVAAYNATTDAAIAAIYATESAFYAAKNAGEDFTAAKHNQQALNLQFLKQVTSL